MPIVQTKDGNKAKTYFFNFTETSSLTLKKEVCTKDAYIQSLSPQGYWLATVSENEVVFWNTVTMLPARHYALDPPLPNVTVIHWIPMGLALVSSGKLYILKCAYSRSFSLAPPNTDIMELSFFSSFLLLTCREGLVMHRLDSNLKSQIHKLQMTSIHASNDRGYQVLLDAHNFVYIFRETRLLFRIILEKPVVSLAIDISGQFVLIGQHRLLSLYKQGWFVSAVPVDYTNFCGFLARRSSFLVYAVSGEHEITIVDLDSAGRISMKGPIAQLRQVTAHPKDQSLVLLSDDGTLYKWRYEEPFLESSLVPHFTLLTTGQDNITAEDCPEDKFNWIQKAPLYPKKRINVGCDIPQEGAFIKNEAWFL